MNTFYFRHCEEKIAKRSGAIFDEAIRSISTMTFKLEGLLRRTNFPFGRFVLLAMTFLFIH